MCRTVLGLECALSEGQFCITVSIHHIENQTIGVGSDGALRMSRLELGDADD